MRFIAPTLLIHTNFVGGGNMRIACLCLNSRLGRPLVNNINQRDFSLGKFITTSLKCPKALIYTLVNDVSNLPVCLFHDILTRLVGWVFFLAK